MKLAIRLHHDQTLFSPCVIDPSLSFERSDCSLQCSFSRLREHPCFIPGTLGLVPRHFISRRRCWCCCEYRRFQVVALHHGHRLGTYTAPHSRVARALKYEHPPRPSRSRPTSIRNTCLASRCRSPRPRSFILQGNNFPSALS